MRRDWNPAILEWMDRPQPVTPELERDLENLEGLNRHFGGHTLVRSFLPAWFQPKPGGGYRVLDLCAGYGDIPRMMLDRARGAAGNRRRRFSPGDARNRPPQKRRLPGNPLPPGRRPRV